MCKVTRLSQRLFSSCSFALCRKPLSDSESSCPAGRWLMRWPWRGQRSSTHLCTHFLARARLAERETCHSAQPYLQGGDSTRWYLEHPDQGVLPVVGPTRSWMAQCLGDAWLQPWLFCFSPRSWLHGGWCWVCDLHLCSGCLVWGCSTGQDRSTRPPLTFCPWGQYSQCLIEYPNAGDELRSQISLVFPCSQWKGRSFSKGQFRAAYSGALSGHKGYIWPTTIYFPISSDPWVSPSASPAWRRPSRRGGCCWQLLWSEAPHYLHSRSHRAAPQPCSSGTARGDKTPLLGAESWMVKARQGEHPATCLSSVRALMPPLWFIGHNTLHWFSFAEAFQA